jgi:hypothetical protein
MWADPLAELLAESSHVQIVLSTSWARHLPFEQVRDFLPVPLRRRVIGSTWHAIHTDPEFSRGLQLSYWQDSTRYQQVKRWVNVHHLRRWVAIDDETNGWGEAGRDKLVATNNNLGPSAPSARVRLAAAVGNMGSAWDVADAMASVLSIPQVARSASCAELVQWVEWWQSSYLNAIERPPDQIAAMKASHWWPPVSDVEIRKMPPAIARRCIP